MELRTRLVIHTDGSDPEPLPAPHFDSAAAISARPVRPITENEETVVRHRPIQPAQPAYPSPEYYTPAPYAYQTAAAYPPKGRSAWRSVLVFFLISGAIGFGLAIGYGISHYRELHAAQPIVAASAFRERASEPELEFTLPPEEEPGEVDLDDADADAEVTIPIDIPVDNEEPAPTRAPRVTRGTNPSVPSQSPPIDSPDDPNRGVDSSGDVRQRRVPGADPRKPSNTRSAKTNPDSSREIRRTRDGIITRIRQIFEGKSD